MKQVMKFLMLLIIVMVWMKYTTGKKLKCVIGKTLANAKMEKIVMISIQWEPVSPTADTGPVSPLIPALVDTLWEYATTFSVMVSVTEVTVVGSDTQLNILRPLF